MNTTASYTPLESLLLFQSLVAHGTDFSAFVNISNHLTNNSLIRDGDTYDARRLSPEALQALYTQLVQEDLRIECEQEGLQDATEPGSRKRKQPSPSASNLKELETLKENIPLLADRLYARYREHMVKGIREDERRYAALQQEIRQIEEGQSDDRIRQGERNSSASNGAPSTLSAVSRPAPNGSSSISPLVYSQESRPLLAPPSGFTPPLQSSASRSHVSSPRLQASPSGSPRLKPPAPVAANAANTLKTPAKPGRASPQPIPKSTPSSTPASISSHKINAGSPAPLPIQPAPLQPPPTEWRWETPFVPGPQHQHNSYQTNTGQPLPSPQWSPLTVPPRASFLSPPGHHGAQASSLASHVPPGSNNYPGYPTPSNQVRLPQASPAGPLDALADAAGQQFRVPGGSPSVSQGPSPRGYATAYPQQPVASPSSGPPASTQWMSGQSQYMPPLHPPTNHTFPPNPAPRPPYPPRPVSEHKRYNSPYNANQALQSAGASGTSAASSDRPSTPAQRSILKHITGKGTAWTPTSSESTPQSGAVLNSPEVEPVSPIPKVADPTSTRYSGKAKKTEAPKPSKNSSRRGTQRRRAGSTASSIIARSHRSQSVASHVDDPMQVDELSTDHDIPPSHTVKQEVATPYSVDDHGETTAEEGHSRNLRGTPASRPTNKRKRISNIEKRQPAGPPTHVLWTRAFSKISASALDTISGHKNASIFAQPVKERDAPGYKDWIFCPQDLKSIRSAITAGSKAASTAAMIAGLDQGQVSIMIPISEDLIPPRGIINNAQLEKELARMYANAIMFNADPQRGFGPKFIVNNGAEQKAQEDYAIDDNTMVNDTLAMHADSEEVIKALRSAERGSEEVGGERETTGRHLMDDDEVDELAGDADGMGSVAKRRRKV